ncbi:rhodanese domain-containing protein [Legionella taurinensis]|uniref:tRNA uridine(34) hydroxylase n=1 Tax=Legionella taurinensis TaxID=70611 RepID=A0A3A5LC34_9GAMM|nr:rhodanese-related sulfurtransferase [Legionella taurinensis]MDX1836367.1 rhodanese-related sulfurtransferase [Legionella taurinensis]PUT41884.1 hypothetical protein DB744_01955 [Legionella taurinensis]PUT44673.1 hypothetical protein DB746_01955 [Legionella taurinensis]PUT47993.1 hypothetical protein DB743_00115 [Legionella taurinensis]PUT48806.1 hypothetical protein DB745_01955 [Legionella taurinensis]
MNSFVIIAFYKFTHIANPEQLREILLSKLIELDIKGTLILANEGINGSFSGTREQVDTFIDYLSSYPEFKGIHFKENYDSSNPFDKSKVKLRKEIVSMGVANVDAQTHAGEYVKPEEWNALIDDDNVLVIDTRNDYEIELGTFKRAINPKTVNFRDFPDYVEKNLLENKDKKIAMFCTGGIRCEKSTAYLKQLGFEKVYHLEGGILNYLEKIPEHESLWQGSCFVFDNRVAVDQSLASLQKGTIDLEWKNKHRQKSLDDMIES